MQKSLARERNMGYNMLALRKASKTGYSAVGSAGGLGPSGRGFKSLYSDQKSVKIVDFDGFFILKSDCFEMRLMWSNVAAQATPQHRNRACEGFPLCLQWRKN